MKVWHTGEVKKLVPQISERQIHYWRAIGAIRPSGGMAQGGNGGRCEWTRRDIARLRTIMQLHEALEPFIAQGVNTNALKRIWRAFEDQDDLVIGEPPVVITLHLADTSDLIDPVNVQAGEVEYALGS